ncbi:hypothetical protein ACOMHN_016661 [Nucella lapillus]
MAAAAVAARGEEGRGAAQRINTTQGRRFVYFDLETTGLGPTRHITQIAARSGQGEAFSTYVLPREPIHERAQEVTGITCDGQQLYHHGAPVPFLTIRPALEGFITFLEQGKPVVLLGHNIKLFDCPILLNALQCCNLVERFQAAVYGCVDTLPLFREINPGLKNHNQAALYKHYIGLQFPAHDARDDVRALQKIVNRANPNHDQFSLNSDRQDHGYVPEIKSVFLIHQLQGEWYDIGRTTFIWGPATWTSQQWNFVQGQDGTLAALFSGVCKACGGCSDTIVYRVTERPAQGGGFLLQGNGESYLGSEIVVSICFAANGANSLNRCPRNKLQVSVLSRQPVMKDVDHWLKIVRHFPVSMDKIDSSAGVSRGLVSSMDSRVKSVVGFSSRRSSILLPCSLGPNTSRLRQGSQMVWRKGPADLPLTRNGTVLTGASGVRLLATAQGRFHLLLRGVFAESVGVYTCYLENSSPVQPGSDRVLLSRVAVSSADFPSRPSIVYHSESVVARKGETVVLECYANGYPPPHLTWWLKSAGAQEAYVRKGRGGSKLRFRNVQTDDEGVYKCEVSSRDDSPVSAFVRLQVGFGPETTVRERQVSVLFGGQLTLTCHVQIKSPDMLIWRKGDADIEPDDRRSVSLIQTSEYGFELRLLIRQMNKDDFGQYSCFAKDQLGESLSAVEVMEQTYVRGRCVVRDIPVMKNFNVQKFLGDTESVQSTGTLWNNQTSVSEVQGLFVTIGGSLVQYYRAFSSEKQHCLEPGTSSLVRLDTPGDYQLTLNGQRARHKIVYTDYTHAVTYTCMSRNDQLPCPQNLELVQILSRQSHIPDAVLQRLYGYVQQTCVPVSSLVETVPGICQMPADFMYRKGWIGKYPELNCQVAKLHTQGNLTAGHVTGKWQLIGEVRPEDYSTPARISLHLVSSGDRLIRLHRSVQSEFCTATEADILHKSMTEGSYYSDYKGRTVDSKILWVDTASLVLYTCLALKHDGTCYSGSELVELYHRHSRIDHNAMLWLLRAVSHACVDVKRLVRVEASDACPVPKRIVRAAKWGEVYEGPTRIGCHHMLIADRMGFWEEKLTGHWTVMYRNVESLPDRSPIGQFSQSYHILHSRPGLVTFMIRHYESGGEWQLCPPTRVLHFAQRSGLGDYIHISHTPIDTAVVYWCQNTGPDGVCSPDSLTVEILVRSAQTLVSKKRLHSMLQSSVDACVQLENMQATSQLEKCTIPDTVVDLVKKQQVTSTFDIPVLTCKNQLIKGENNLDVEKLTGKWMVMWRNKEFWAVRSPLAESSFLIATHYGLLYIWRSWNNDLDRCGPEEAGRFITTSGPGDYYSGFDGVPVAMKILKLTDDGNTMLAMWCHLDDNSRCHPHRTTIEILSRSAVLDNDTRDELFSLVDLDCVSAPEWVPSDPGVCQVENDVLTAAYIDGLDSVEYSKIGCRVDLIEGQPGITEDLIVGSWRSVYQSNLSDSEGSAAMIDFHFTKTAEGPISLLYRLYSAAKKECLPSRVLELTHDDRKSTGVFQLKHCDREEPYGYVYVLYADGDHLGILLCTDVRKDGMCDPQTQNLGVNQTLIDAVTGLGADACVDPLSLVIPELDPCPVPEPILTDALRGELEACSGTWYTAADAVTEGRMKIKAVQSITYHFVPKTDGSVAMLYTARESEVCQPTELRLLGSEADGHFNFTIDQRQGMMKVVWMDSNLALTYWCFDVETAEPWCPKMDVILLSRQPLNGEGWEMLAELPTRVADLCVSSKSFVTVSSESCTTPGDILSAVEEDTFAIAASFSVIQCAHQFVPRVTDFNMTQFSGVWHTVRQTDSVWDHAVWQSMIQSFVVQDNHTVIMAFARHLMGKDRCMPMDIRVLTLSNTSGQWSYMDDNETVTVKVVWTDYNSSALLYSCKGEAGEDGSCPHSNLHVELLSRNLNVTREASEMMVRILPTLCVEEREMRDVVTGSCQISKELEQLVGNIQGGGADLVTPCRVQDIPLEKNFTLQQMRGTWFEVARTRFTFNTMESVISVYNYHPDTDMLAGLFIGSLHKQCQSPLQIQTRKKSSEGPDSIIEGRIQVGESIFPWITFNILYYDGDMLMHMACYGESDDGTCPRSKTEVTIIGRNRSRQLTENMEGTLDTLMHNVCLEREDLVPTTETADCLPKLMAKEEKVTGLPDTSACKLSNIPVVDSLNESDMVGVWYGLRTVDYSTEEEPSGFVVSIQRSADYTLKWRHWNIRNGSCPGEKATYLKAACVNSSDGTHRGDYISTKASSFMLQWTAFKIVRLQGDLMLVYSCTREVSEGTCEPEGMRVDLLGRRTSATSGDVRPALDALPSLCLKPEFMKPLVSSSRCTLLDVGA